MILKTIIIDDEHNAIKSLEILINEYCPQLEIVATASTVNDAVLLIQTEKPDLVFLDIEMPTGSGFEVLEKTQDYDYKVIFTTAYEQYALKAFKVNASDYLLKPIDEQELMNAVNKISSDGNVQSALAAISKMLLKPAETKISIPTNDGFLIVEPNSIIRIESDSNYTWFHIQEKGKFLVSKTLKDAEKQMEKYGFIRVHNSHLVNPNHIIKFLKTSGGSLILTDQSEIPISKRKKIDVIALFE